MNYLFLIFTLLILICRCQGGPADKPKTDNKIASPPPAAAPPLPEDDSPLGSELFKAWAEGLSEANRYQVKLLWKLGKEINPPADPEAWSIKRISDIQGVQSLSTLPGNRREYIDTQVTPGMTYEYWLMSQEPSTIKRKFTITLPRDLLIQTKIQLKEIQGIERLFLSGGAVLAPLDNSLQIKVKEIHSDHGSIQSYLDATQAPEGTPGRSGPTIIIKANSGSGVLNLTAKGERGGNGITGSRGLAGMAGKNGNAATLSPAVPKIHFDAALQLIARNATPVPATDPIWKKLYQCENRPTNGENGTAGAAGGRGGKGANGGDTSPVYIEIKNAAGIKIIPTQVPGLPGFGGNGGPGGKGGPGGLAGAGDSYGICPAATAGLEGAAGLTGEMGDPGKEGGRSALCLKLGNSTLGDCDFFQGLL